MKWSSSTIGVCGSYCSISVWAMQPTMWHNDFAEFQMDRRTGANFIERPIEMPGQQRERKREREKSKERKEGEKKLEREGERERERQLEHQRLPTKSSRSAWLKLTINYTAQQANQFSCSHMNSSFVLVAQPCCTVLANNSNWQIEPPIGQLAAQLRPRIAARFGIRIDKAAFNCRNDRQRATEREGDGEIVQLPHCLSAFPRSANR